MMSEPTRKNCIDYLRDIEHYFRRMSGMYPNEVRYRMFTDVAARSAKLLREDDKQPEMVKCSCCDLEYHPDFSKCPRCGRENPNKEPDPLDVEKLPKKDFAHPRYGMGNEYIDWICPSCDFFLAFDCAFKDIPRRCPNCGQLIKRITREEAYAMDKGGDNNIWTVLTRLSKTSTNATAPKDT